MGPCAVQACTGHEMCPIAPLPTPVSASRRQSQPAESDLKPADCFRKEPIVCIPPRLRSSRPSLRQSEALPGQSSRDVREMRHS